MDKSNNRAFAQRSSSQPQSPNCSPQLPGRQLNYQYEVQQSSQKQNQVFRDMYMTQGTNIQFQPNSDYINQKLDHFRSNRQQNSSYYHGDQSQRNDEESIVIGNQDRPYSSASISRLSDSPRSQNALQRMKADFTNQMNYNQKFTQHSLVNSKSERDAQGLEINIDSHHKSEGSDNTQEAAFNNLHAHGHSRSPKSEDDMQMEEVVQEQLRKEALIKLQGNIREMPLQSMNQVHARIYERQQETLYDPRQHSNQMMINSGPNKYMPISAIQPELIKLMEKQNAANNIQNFQGSKQYNESYNMNRIEQFEQQESRNTRNNDHQTASPSKNLHSNTHSSLSSPQLSNSVNSSDEKKRTQPKDIEDDLDLIDSKQIKEVSDTKQESQQVQEYQQQESQPIENVLYYEFNVTIQHLVEIVSNQGQQYMLEQLSSQHLKELETKILQHNPPILENKIESIFNLMAQIEERRHGQSSPQGLMICEKQDNTFDDFQPHGQCDDVETHHIEFDWTPEEKFRAKLYQLDHEGRWQDLGTGYFSIIEIKNCQRYQMSLMQELTSTVDLLENEIIDMSISFHRQRETIITWSDKTNQRDLAVSFQNNSGALYTWQKICQIIGKDPEMNSQDSQVQEEEDIFAVINFDTVPKMAEELRALSGLDNQVKHEIAERFLENDCHNLQKLGELFDECEQDESTNKQERNEFLFCFFCIYKGLISLNDQRLIEALLSNSFHLHTFGALEYDPEALIEDFNEDIPEESKQVTPTKESEEKSKQQQLIEKFNLKVHEQSMILNQQGSNITFNHRESKKLWQESNMYNVRDRSPSHEGTQSIAHSDSESVKSTKTDTKKKQPEPAEVEYNRKEKSTLNYREFLSNIVKFKQVIDLSPSKLNEPEPVINAGTQDNVEPTPTQGTGIAHGESENIEERIHINYRLQFLKDTVMARYIDDQSVNVINQIIMHNNREIVHYIFDEDDSKDRRLRTGASRSLKDQIIEKISNKTDMKTRHLAIEFMIELCQILKSLQFQPGGIGNGSASNFIYGQGGASSRSMYDQLTQVNFMGILAETFGIFIPNEESLIAHLNRDPDSYKERLMELYKKNTQFEDKIIEDLIEMKRERNCDDNEKLYFYDQTTRLDSMKVNSMEIIISFQQSVHVPASNITSFIMGTEQSCKGYPLLNQLVQHLIYSPEQGLKIQICEFFKQLMEGDQNHLTSYNKDVLYKELIAKFVQFLTSFSEQGDFNILQANEDSNSAASINFRKMKCLEYSAYLILQILNKVVAEHRYPFRQYMTNLHVIQNVAKLVNLNSKLLNIEIVKFYKALLKSKDTTYIQYIVLKNQFYPINKIFVDTYHARNPPMIQSCIRDLYEIIFSNSKGNDYFNQKLMDYLMNTDKESKLIIHDPKYRDVFAKYDKLANKQDQETFLNNNSEGSFGGSPVSIGQQMIRKEEQDPVRYGDNKAMIWGWNSREQVDDRLLINDFNNDDDIDDIDDVLVQPNSDKDNKEKQDEGNPGNLSPIGNSNFLRDKEEISQLKEVDEPEEEIEIEPKETSTSCFLFELQNEINQSNQDIPIESSQHSVNITLEVEQDKQSPSKLSGNSNEQEPNKADESELKIKLKKEETNSTGKLLVLKEEKNASRMIHFQKSTFANKAHSSHEVMYERLSASSQELHGMIGEDDLCKDMGIFSYEINKKSCDALPFGNRKSSLDEFDLESRNAASKSSNGKNSIFVNGRKDLSNSSKNLTGIFKNKKGEKPIEQKRSHSGESKIKGKTSPPLIGSDFSELQRLGSSKGSQSPKNKEFQKLELTQLQTQSQGKSAKKADTVKLMDTNPSFELSQGDEESSPNKVLGQKRKNCEDGETGEEEELLRIKRQKTENSQEE